MDNLKRFLGTESHPPIRRRCVGPAVQGTHIPLPAGGSKGRARHLAAAGFGGLASTVALPKFDFRAGQGVVAPYRIRAHHVQNQIESRSLFTVTKRKSLAPQGFQSKINPVQHPLSEEKRWKRHRMRVGELCPSERHSQ